MLFTDLTLKDGSQWSWEASRPTTLDFIKINEFYCPALMGPVVHEPASIIDCLTPDETGLVPPIFRNRLCDNFNDCPDGEDEDSSLAQCEIKGDLSKNGCCQTLIISSSLETFKKPVSIRGSSSLPLSNRFHL